MSNPNSAPLLATLTATSVAGAVTVIQTTGLAECLDAYPQLMLRASIAGSAGGTTDVYLQSRHGSADWIDVAHFPQVAAGGATVLYAAQLDRSAFALAPLVIGTAITPALAANTVRPGDFGDALRMVIVGGAGSAGGAVSTCDVYGCAAPGGRA